MARRGDNQMTADPRLRAQHARRAKRGACCVCNADGEVHSVAWKLWRSNPKRVASDEPPQTVECEYCDGQSYGMPVGSTQRAENLILAEARFVVTVHEGGEYASKPFTAKELARVPLGEIAEWCERGELWAFEDNGEA